VILSLPLSLLCSTLGNGEAPQWGGFRGNNGAGIGTAVGLPDALDPEGTLMWRSDVPSGYSSPVVAGKNLFVTGAVTTGAGRTVSGKLSTVCLDALTGEPRWKKELDFSGARPGMNSPAAPTPATDGEVVVVLFHHVGLLAYDMAGKELWKQAIGPFNIPHGMASSPLLYGELAILQVDQDGGAYLVAYDKKTGAQRWKTERPGVTHSYATPAIHQPASGPAQVVVSGTFQVAAYSVSDGAKLWWMDGAAWQTKSVPLFARGRCYLNSFMAAPSEMEYPSFGGDFAAKDADKDGKVTKKEYGEEQPLWFLFDQDKDDALTQTEWAFALSSNTATGGLFAFECGTKGEVPAASMKWKTDDRRSLSDLTTPVIVGDVLFSIQKGGILTSMDLESGKVIKQERVGQPDDYYASPVAADGKLYLASKSGILTVVKAVPEWEQLASHPLEDEEVWATPAIAGKAVYVRGTEALYCFEKPE
jgi:outer membrane protein assembly factor BamB